MLTFLVYLSTSCLPRFFRGAQSSFHLCPILKPNEMNAITKSLNPKSKSWTIVFAIVAGSFVTGMTGYVTMGMNFPLVLITAIGINFLLAQFMNHSSDRHEISLYKKVIHLFDGNLGQFFSSFAGMLILLVLLVLATGEGKTGALALQQILDPNTNLLYYIIIICGAAMLIAFMKLKKHLDIIFYLFTALIVLRTLFIVFFLLRSAEVPEWSLANLYNSIQLSDFQGSHGVVFIAFRLAFWSMVGLEVFSLWKRTSVKGRGRKMIWLFAISLLLVFTIIPGIYMAGVFPYELWQLFVLGSEGCYGACPDLALAYNFGGTTGKYLMATSIILSHLLMVSISFMLISRIIMSLSRQKLFFSRLSAEDGSMALENKYLTLLLVFVLSVVLSSLNLSASYWVGLSLYMSFGFILIAQLICLLNLHFKWFASSFLGNQSLLLLSALSVVMMGILFYSGFKGEHAHFLNFAFALFCFSLWVAASSIVYLMKINKTN